MRKGALVAVAAVAAMLVSAVQSPVEARGARVDQIPNGAVLGCGGCHTNPAGGGSRNAFGLMLENGYLTDLSYLGSVVWGPELAALDADGDGASNGQELGDPDGSWSMGDPNPGDPADVTDINDAESFPPPPTAVEASSWANIKKLTQD